MMPNMVKESMAGWMLPGDVLERPPPRACEAYTRQVKSTSKKRRTRLLVGNDILMPVQKRQVVLDSFYDD